MVTYQNIRRASRRSLLAVLSSIATLGMAASTLQAQTPYAASGVPQFNLSDIPLADGEQIISSDAGLLGSEFQYDGANYQTVTPSAVPTAASGGNFISPMGNGPCASGNCGPLGQHTSHCAPGTELAGVYGRRYDLGGHPRLGMAGNVCGPTCDPYIYASVEALYMDHNDASGFAMLGPTVSPAFRDFDYEFGSRITVGVLPDCRNGYEFSFTGQFEWDTNNGLAPGVAGYQRLEAEYLSFEFNRTLVGWDIVKLLYGVRYAQYEEEYTFGSLLSAPDNDLFGAQVGADMTYPLTCRAWTDMRARAGVFANFAEHRGSDFNKYDDEEVAGIFEFGGGVRYYLTNNFYVRGGGELMYLANVATGLDQFGPGLASVANRKTRIDDNIFLYGFSFGAELKF